MRGVRRASPRNARWYGEWMRDEAEKRIGHLYPKARVPDGTEATVIAWLWARTVKSPNPAARGAIVPLVSSFLLSTKPGKEAWVEIVPDASAHDGRRFELRNAKEHGTPPTPAKNGTRHAKGANSAHGGAADGDRRRRARRSHLPAARRGAGEDRGECTPKLGPRVGMPKKALGFRVQEYGMTRHCDLFTPRQLVVLTTFSDLVLEARAKAVENAKAAEFFPDSTPLADGGTGAQAYADALTTYLALATDRLADRLSSLCGWDSGYVKIRNTFGRQALPMVWDYAEGNPFSNSSGNFEAATIWVAKAIEHGPTRLPGSAMMLDAANGTRPAPSSTSTDPPYYDNIGYADLSDFFYVWLRRTLKDVFPREFGTVLVPKERELVATPYRFRSGQQEAERFFLDGMRRAIANVHRASVGDVPTTIYYAFKQAEIETEGVVSIGWATFLEAAIDAGFEVDGTWPARTELSNRMVGRGANALASSIVLVCRKAAQGRAEHRPGGVPAGAATGAAGGAEDAAGEHDRTGRYGAGVDRPRHGGVLPLLRGFGGG